jgi:hypothetical protein
VRRIVSGGVRSRADVPYEWIDWDSVEDHHNFQADHEAYRKFVELFKPTAKDGKPKGTIIYAYWDVDEALPCLKAPLVELTKITAKEGIAKKDIYAVLDKYIAHIRSLVDGATYGDVYEKPGQIVLVIGWKSIQVKCIFFINLRIEKN